MKRSSAHQRLKERVTSLMRAPIFAESNACPTSLKLHRFLLKLQLSTSTSEQLAKADASTSTQTCVHESHVGCREKNKLARWQGSR